MTSPQLRVGIVAAEFFDPAVGTMGGFGFLVAQAARALAEDANSPCHVEFLCGSKAPAGIADEVLSRGIPLHFNVGRPDRRGLSVDRFDVLLSMDYRPGYYRVFDHFSRTPKVLWVVDPRPQSDVEKIDTLRIPGQENERPQGIDAIDCSGLALWRPRILRPWRGRIAFAAPLASLGEKFAGTYGFPAPRHLHFLPYPLPLASRAGVKDPAPSVVFLGRLDPIKRPWVFVEVARQVPEADFILMGRNHFSGAGSWVPENLPSNVKWMGHVEGEEKRRTISQAWALVNPSIHEALPVSFVEAFAAGIPVISCQDPGGLVSRFGTYVGRFDGSGLDAVAPIANAIRNMTAARSTEPASSARDWAISHHSADHFRARFFELCTALRVSGASARSSGSSPAGKQTADDLPKRIDDLG